MNENIENGNKSHIQIKVLTNNESGKCTATSFTVLSSPGFEKADYFLDHKFVEMESMLDESIDEEFEYPIKSARKASEGRKAQDGKAVRITLKEGVLTIGIYIQTYGKPWVLSHTHIVDKIIFDSYVSVAKNDVDVISREQVNDRELRRSFTLNLD